MDFLLEFAKLIKKTPRLGMPQQDCENCPYNSYIYRSRNCYLCFGSSILDSCYYLNTCTNSRDCADCAYLTNCELCYECVDCDECYNCNFCQDSKNCRDCEQCYDCKGCTHCFGCVGLRKKEFHIFNEPVSKEKFAEKLREAKALPPSEIKRRIDALRLVFVHPPMHTTNSENCFGDYILNSKNCFMCFNVEKCEDSAYLYDEMYEIKDCFDCTHIHRSQLCYNLMSADQCYNVDSSWWMANCRDCVFGICNNGCSNCFGCVNIKRREFHILNQPYSKEDYFKKVAEIKDDLTKRGLYGKYLVSDALELAKTL